MDEGDSADEDDPELPCLCLVSSRRTASRIILHACVWVQRGQPWTEASAGMSPDDAYSLNFGITIWMKSWCIPILEFVPVTWISLSAGAWRWLCSLRFMAIALARFRPESCNSCSPNREMAFFGVLKFLASGALGAGASCGRVWISRVPQFWLASVWLCGTFPRLKSWMTVAFCYLVFFVKYTKFQIF